jgi:hypothetical protein
MSGKAPTLFMRTRLTALGAAAALSAPGTGALAHFTLLEPESWIVESALGDPQKDGPCGGVTGTPTGTVTTVQAGETITLRWQETIYHSGHWRIAVARDRSELQDPAVASMVDSRCNYPAGAADVPAEYPVLMDNLFPRTAPLAAAQMFEHEITIPDMNCELCTLQVIQFMTNHAPPCIYYHCADITIIGATDPPAAGICGDLDDSGVIGATDALRLLQKAVGVDVEIKCPGGCPAGDGQ